MDSIKCSQCGLINVSTDAVCERCQTSLVDTGKSEVSESQKPTSQTRIVNLQCISCSERLEVAPDMKRFACGYCGTEQVVERRGGTVALKAVAESASFPQTDSNETAVQIARERFEREIEALEKERTHQHPQPMKVNRAKTEPNMEKIAVLIIGGIIFIGIVLSIISEINKRRTKDLDNTSLQGQYNTLTSSSPTPIESPTATPAASTKASSSSKSSPAPRDVTESDRDWAGIAINTYLKEILNDPSSLQDFEMLSISPIKKRPEFYEAVVRYRARNGFGGMVLQQQRFILVRNPNQLGGWSVVSAED